MRLGIPDRDPLLPDVPLSMIGPISSYITVHDIAWHLLSNPPPLPPNLPQDSGVHRVLVNIMDTMDLSCGEMVNRHTGTASIPAILWDRIMIKHREHFPVPITRSSARCGCSSQTYPWWHPTYYRILLPSRGDECNPSLSDSPSLLQTTQTAVAWSAMRSRFCAGPPTVLGSRHQQKCCCWMTL